MTTSYPTTADFILYKCPVNGEAKTEYSTIHALGAVSPELLHTRNVCPAGFGWRGFFYEPKWLVINSRVSSMTGFTSVSSISSQRGMRLITGAPK